MLRSALVRPNLDKFHPPSSRAEAAGAERFWRACAPLPGLSTLPGFVDDALTFWLGRSAPNAAPYLLLVESMRTSITFSNNVLKTPDESSIGKGSPRKKPALWPPPSPAPRPSPAGVAPRRALRGHSVTYHARARCGHAKDPRSPSHTSAVGCHLGAGVPVPRRWTQTQTSALVAPRGCAAAACNPSTPVGGDICTICQEVSWAWTVDCGGDTSAAVFCARRMSGEAGREGPSTHIVVLYVVLHK
ncbi:hypothetical protein PsYK624_130610 [Phanerochaete sordida]|uniref:Uncharacterized protein n=1 Tax=Phanerochaete sordida TaxID=48140 RepID=A0A9P3GMA7_9APHY|nr:hypothetical protein PsYK624_130610 [Phanerochaete sordida]